MAGTLRLISSGRLEHKLGCCAEARDMCDVRSSKKMDNQHMNDRRQLPATFVGLCLATAVIAGQAPPVQPVPPVTFKMDINYVDVSVRVLDDQGNFVPNLKAG